MHHIFWTSNGLPQGMVYDLPGDIALGLKKVVERSTSSAGTINSYYPVLHQHVPGPAFPADLKKALETSIAAALQSINYNTQKNGVTVNPMCLYSQDHKRQLPHQDDDPSQVTQAALASDPRPCQCRPVGATLSFDLITSLVKDPFFLS